MKKARNRGGRRPLSRKSASRATEGETGSTERASLQIDGEVVLSGVIGIGLPAPRCSRPIVGRSVNDDKTLLHHGEEVKRASNTQESELALVDAFVRDEIEQSFRILFGHLLEVKRCRPVARAGEGYDRSTLAHGENGAAFQHNRAVVRDSHSAARTVRTRPLPSRRILGQNLAADLRLGAKKGRLLKRPATGPAEGFRLIWGCRNL